MTKYVIDLPDGTTAVVAKKSSFLNETDVMRIPASQLELYVEPTVAENATVEKRVIELPADSIAWLERMKSNLETIDVYDLLNNVLDNNSGSYHAYQFNFNSETAALNTLAEWLLGHVEFVPKKEQQYAVETKFGYVMAIYSGPGKKLGVSEFTYDDYTQNFTENEADEIIAGLGGENGLLKPRKVKVEE